MKKFINNIKNSSEFKKGLYFALFVFAIAIILEFTLFNFRFYESRNYQEISNFSYRLGKGLKLNKDHSISIISDKDNYIEINDINTHLNNIYLDFVLVENEIKSQVVNMAIGYTDNANRYVNYAYPQRVYMRNKNEHEYMKLHLSGKTRRIRLSFEKNLKNVPFKINKISFNKPVPFNFSIIRLGLIVFFSLVIYFFRPKSFIYKMGLFNKKSIKILSIVTCVQILFMVGVSFFNYYFISEDFDTLQRYQYQLLAEAFKKGQTNLDVEVSPVLKNLKNPYDRSARAKAFRHNKDEEYIWDAAYYKGKYYVYFGVAPVILYYYPVYALTGYHIKTSSCIIITMIATVIGIILLLYEICKKWFNKVSLGSFLAISILFINACGLLSIMGRPDHYSLPILMAIMFSVYGLLCWLKACNEKLNTGYLLLGSLCMASVAACRPQLLLTSFFAIPIFLDYIKKRKLFSKTSVKQTIAFMAPFIIIAILLMVYNMVRFGSPFDFGANYNLTTNDMTKRGFVLGRIPLGIFYYLFNPINVKVIFPYIIREPLVVTSYTGTTIYEPMGAGFLFANLICLFGLFIWKYKSEFKDKLPFKLGVLSIIFSIIIIIADTEMAGILPRYICDFGFLIYFVTSIVLFNKLHNKKDNLNKIIFIALVFGLVYNFLLLFSDTVVQNSWLCFHLRKIFDFWR